MIWQAALVALVVSVAVSLFVAAVICQANQRDSARDPRDGARGDDVPYLRTRHPKTGPGMG